jgi:hypothetical protein
MATNNPIKWSALATVVNLFAADALKNLAAAGISGLSGEVDNTSGNQYADFVLLWNPVSTPAAGGYISAWLIKADDGTNYETLLGATLIPQRPADIIFPIGSEAASAHAAQRITVGPKVLPACKFKVVVQNNTSVANENTTSASLLDMYAYNDNLVTP